MLYNYNLIIKTSQPIRITMKRIMINVAALAFAAALATLSSCSSKNDTGAAANPAAMAPQIATMPLDYESIELSQSYPATIKGKTDIEIRPQVSGFITQVLVDEGQQVSKGQTLFILDQVQFQAAVDQAIAQLNAAETRLNSAKLTAEQKQSLYDKNIISEYENLLAKNDLAAAEANLSTAKAALTNAEKNLAYTVVTSPSNGVVGSIPFRQGSLASPSMGQPLTTVSDNSEVYAYFSLTEKDILNMTDNGQSSLKQIIASMPEVGLRLADGQMFPTKGKVATVSGVIGAGTGASTVRALFRNSNGLLRSGSTGQVVFPVKIDSALVIPQKSTFEIQDRRFVYVVNDSNRVVPTTIQVSPVSDGQIFIVENGLKKGDRIAIEGVGNVLKPDMLINPVEAPQQAQ